MQGMQNTGGLPAGDQLDLIRIWPELRTCTAAGDPGANESEGGSRVRSDAAKMVPDDVRDGPELHTDAEDSGSGGW